MTTYAVGDLQGCFQPLKTLLEHLNFDENKDVLWVAGDLVNRGPDSLKCLQFIKSLGKSAKVVLGNHDLHLLAIYHGIKSLNKNETLRQVIESDDCDDLMTWLKQQPLIQYDAHLNTVMTHAGIAHIFSLEHAQRLAKEVSDCLKNKTSCLAFLKEMYGNVPNIWSDDLKGNDRLRAITNYFTRMRFIKVDGTLDFEAKESLDSAPEGFKPWFSFYEKEHELNYVFGHWAALMGQTRHKNIHGLDTGYVWGNQLTIMNLESKETFSIDAAGKITSTLDVRR
jgi:bis(5'-nucleosyl)-tetraphosphatase (symmetrical)